MTRRFLFAVVAAAVAACGDNPSAPNGGSSAEVPAHIAQVSGAVGLTASGFETADSVAIRVTDQLNNPIAGQAVTFSVVTGGGAVSHATKPTGPDGIARTAWTIGGTGAQTLRATAGTLTADVTASAVSCNELTLAVGEVRLLDPANAPCAVLNGNAKRYFVTIVNPMDLPLPSAGYTGRGLPGEMLSGVANTVSTALVAAPSFTESEASIHASILEKNMAVLQRYHPEAPTVWSGATHVAAEASRPSVGDLIPMKVPDATVDLCTAFTPVVARVVYVGSKVIVLEDIDNTLKGQVDTLLTRVAHEFDDVMFPILSTNFGNPLAMDAHLNNDGALYMLVSDKVNKSGATGFVSNADLVPSSQCPSSNMAEVFYARSLSTPGTSTGELDFSFASTSRRLASVVIHEVKHLTSFATKMAQPGFSGTKPPQDGWLEESSAEIAMELLSRVTYARPVKSNLDYATTLAKEARPASGLPLNMFHPFTYLYTYFAAPETHSLVGTTGGGDLTFYGSGWSFLRWVIDTYATDEAAFLTAMTRDVSHWGVANIENLTGRSFPQLLSEYSLAVALDDYPGFTPKEAKYSFPSWNLRSIFAGMNSDFPTMFPLAAPLAVHSTAFGKFVVEVSGVRGGGFSIVELAGTQANKQLLEFKGLNGSALPGDMRVNIARVQ